MFLSAHRINLLQNYNYNKLCLGNSITYCSFFYTVTFRNQVFLFPVTIRTKLSLNSRRDGSLIVNHILLKREKIFLQPTVGASKRSAECAEKG